MKPVYYILSIILILISIVIIVNRNGKSFKENLNYEEDIEVVDSNENDENQINIPEEAPEKLTPPKDDEIVKKIKEEQKLNSQFLRLGCCNDEPKREDACCCEAIVEEYRKILLKKDMDKISRLSEDVIFADCKSISKWRIAIEKVEEEVFAE